MPKQKPDIKRVILIRVRFLYGLMLLLALSVIVRIVWIQYGPQGDELRKMAYQRSYKFVAVEADRGNILARDGRLLAVSVPMFEIRMDFAAQGLVDSVFRKNVDSLATRLSTFFGDRPKSSYKSMLQNAYAAKAQNRYKLISPRRVNYIELNEIKKFPLFRLGQNKGGLLTPKISERENPHQSLARRTIGMVNESGTKIGIEGAFDQYLRGVEGRALMLKISGSFRVEVRDEGNIEPKNGIDVVTTLDVDMQDVAENALKQQLESGDALWGSVVLMEVATGEIRAMSNLTRKGKDQFVEDQNYAIAKRLEPGSTFKLATLIALLEDGKMSLDDPINCENGRAMVGKTLVIDDHKLGVIPLRKVFELSSNIGFSKPVYQKYGSDPKRFVDFISTLGFDKPLGMQLSSESGNPIVKRPGGRGWDGMTLVKMSHGYALEITPMHTLMLFNAVANGGKMMRPLLVKELKEYGKTVQEFPSEVTNPAICSPKTLAQVRTCLEGTVDEGTARLLRNPYYKVAAKTGTAQIAQGRRGYMDQYGGRYYLATLVGYYPADKPKYSCIVTISTYYRPGSGKTFYGASLAGPVFKAVADRVYASDVSLQHPDSEPVNKNRTPVLLKGGDVEQVKKVADRLSFPISGWRGEEQWCSTAIDSTTMSVSGFALVSGVVPSVEGMGLKEAVYLLENQGLRVSFSGKGRVVSQSVAAGSAATHGQLIEIRLSL